MSRHWSVRVFRALLALWFVLSVGEPSVVHFCPMHGGLLGELRGARAMADMPGMAMPSSAMRMPASAHGSASGTGAPQSHGSKSTHTHCTCIDCCVGAAAAAVLPSSAVALAPSEWRAAGAPVVAFAETLPRPAPPHAQPPGTGPPRA